MLSAPPAYDRVAFLKVAVLRFSSWHESVCCGAQLLFDVLVLSPASVPRILGAIQLTTAEEAAARLRLHIGALTELAATMAAEPAASLFPFAANLRL